MIWTAAALLGTACLPDQDLSTDVREASPNDFWALTLSAKGLNLAVGGTFALDATPRDYLGNSLDGLPDATYRTLNDRVATVDPATGTVTAIGVGQTSVIATLTDTGTFARSDTTNVNVHAAAAPVVSGLTLGVLTGDSLIVAALGPAKTTIVARVPGTGQAYSALTPPMAAYYTSRTPAVATVNATTGAVTPLTVGSTVLVAHSVVGGQVYRDSVTLTVTWPLTATVTITPPSPPQSATEYFFPGTLDVQRGATVTFNNATNPANPPNLLHPTGVAFTITFDDPSGVTGGNITGLAPGTNTTRRFLTPGTYTYTGTGGVTGRIVVH